MRAPSLRTMLLQTGLTTRPGLITVVQIQPIGQSPSIIQMPLGPSLPRDNHRVSPGLRRNSSSTALHSSSTTCHSTSRARLDRKTGLRDATLTRNPNSCPSGQPQRWAIRSLNGPSFLASSTFRFSKPRIPCPPLLLTYNFSSTLNSSFSCEVACQIITSKGSWI
jgi:hypothetical protein